MKLLDSVKYYAGEFGHLLHENLLTPFANQTNYLIRRISGKEKYEINVTNQDGFVLLSTSDLSRLTQDTERCSDHAFNAAGVAGGLFAVSYGLTFLISNDMFDLPGDLECRLAMGIYKSMIPVGIYSAANLAVSILNDRLYKKEEKRAQKLLEEINSSST